MRPYLSHLNLFQRALNILRPLDKIWLLNKSLIIIYLYI